MTSGWFRPHRDRCSRHRRACDRVREYGGEVTREPGPMKHGTTVIAFVKDPDGYTIEFIEKNFAFRSSEGGCGFPHQTKGGPWEIQSWSNGLLVLEARFCSVRP